MTIQTKSVTFASEEGISVSYSIRLEEKEYEPETVSPKEAAKVIDKVYEVDPCNPSEEETEDEEKTEEEINEEVKNKLISAFSIIDYNPCKYEEGSNDYEKDIYVYRSHVDIPYNLVLNNGNVKQTKKEDFEVYEAVKVSGKSVQLNAPIIEILYCDILVDSFNGNNLYFSYEINGYIRIRYKTQHDVVTVKVNGTEEGAQSCKYLAFYQGLVAELTIEPPEEDEDAKDLIGCTITDVEDEEEPEEPEDRETCYQRYFYRRRCRCSGSVKNSEEVVREVSCNKVGASGTVQGVYNTFQDDVQIDTYTSCPDEEGEWEGADPEFYKDKCCKWPPIDRLPLPICQSITRNITGGKGPPDFDPQPYSNWTVSYVPVNPKDGICGTWTNEWEVSAKDCCDDPSYTPLVYDFEDSVDVLADNSSGIVFWFGGLDSNTVTVRGTGFWVDANFTKKSKETNSKHTIVYTDENACGVCTVEIEDGCTSIEGGISAAEGEWEWYDDDPALCSASGGEVTEIHSRITRTSSAEKMIMSHTAAWACSSSGCSCDVNNLVDHCSGSIEACEVKVGHPDSWFCGLNSVVQRCIVGSYGPTGESCETYSDGSVGELRCRKLNGYPDYNTGKDHYRWVC